MPSDFSDATAEAAALTLRMGSAAVDASAFLVDLGEQLPIIKPVLLTLRAIHEKVEAVKDNRAEMVALENRCNYITACFVARSRESPNLQMDVVPLKECVEVAGKFIERCGGRGRVSRVLKASSDKVELAGINARIDRLAGDLRLRRIATLMEVVCQLKTMLVSVVVVPATCTPLTTHRRSKPDCTVIKGVYRTHPQSG